MHFFGKSEACGQVIHFLKEDKPFWVGGLVGSAVSFLLKEVFLKNNQNLLLVCNDKEEAAYLYNDLETLLSPEQVAFFPASYARPYQVQEVDNANVLLRAEILNKMSQNPDKLMIVTHPEALFEKVISQQEINRKTLKISLGQTLPLSQMEQALEDFGFRRAEFVTEPGEFSVRGGIVDIFSFSNDVPYRIELFGDEVDSIRTFDVETQLSTQRVNHFSVVANVEDKSNPTQRQNFLHMLKNTSFWAKDFELFATKIDKLFAKAQEHFQNLQGGIAHLPPQDLFCTSPEISQWLEAHQVIKINPVEKDPNTPLVFFDTYPQPSMNRRFELLITHLEEKFQQGYTNYIACINEQQAKRCQEILSELKEDVPCQVFVLPLYQGFSDKLNRVNCYTDHQLMERYHKFNLRNGYTKKQSITLKELNQLQVGDYVTHIDHGIGKFAGLHKIDINGNTHEAIKLIYGEGDALFVNIQSLDKIAKYNGKDGKEPKIYKLGSNAWKNLKQKTKARVKEIAFNLINLYAKRKEASGYAFAPDSYLQKELEASFIYEDTPDQSKATTEVKLDMESPKPMDRLVCGDVGFGKTEVAIRAAFKAVDNGKQVAVLVPTTILAFQHYKTFAQRLKDLPLRVEYLNRFRTAKEKRLILEDVQKGKIDILIGTHQIVSEKVKYRDLGLLIIDEEQKFGVGVKDKLKTLKENLDVLTLTATPIPRTLQFSLMAARDLSVITTPPPNRYPIESHLIEFNEEILRDAISYEIQRGGQVFFIHNRIDNIRDVAGIISRLVPDARIGVGHGQMEGKQLEEMMLAFMNGDFDVLVSTTIIESGLDVPNANTIFINNAQRFGLSDLHQMRGRVGRSNKKAFCYFVTPKLSTLTEEARKRLQAITQFSDLGSGLNIALKDLEIRGAGDLLGGEQSGFINDIGFETYQKILQEAVTELKENEFAELYHDTDPHKNYSSDLQIDTDFPMLLPDTYISSTPERLNLYKELSNLTHEEDLQAFEASLRDRFGALPPEAQNLLTSMRIKWAGLQLGLERIVLKNHKLTGYFISDPEHSFFQSKRFEQIIARATQWQNHCKLEEKQTRNGLKLLITFPKIDSLPQALDTLTELLTP